MKAIKYFTLIFTIFCSLAYAQPGDGEELSPEEIERRQQLCADFLQSYTFENSFSRAEIAGDITAAFSDSTSHKPKSHFGVVKLRFAHPGIASNIALVLNAVRAMPCEAECSERKSKISNLEKNLWGVALALKPKIFLGEMEELSTVVGRGKRPSNDLFTYINRLSDRMVELVDELKLGHVYYNIDKLPGDKSNAPRRPEKVAPEITETLMVLFLTSGQHRTTFYQDLQDTTAFYGMSAIVALFAMMINNSGDTHSVPPLLAAAAPLVLFIGMFANGWRRDEVDMARFVGDEEALTKAKGPILRPKIVGWFMQYWRARYVRKKVGTLVKERIDHLEGFEKGLSDGPVEMAAFLKHISLEVDKFRTLIIQEKTNPSAFLNQVFMFLEGNSQQNIFDLMGRFSNAE